MVGPAGPAAAGPAQQPAQQQPAQQLARLSGSHLKFLAFVRILHELRGVYDELRHRSVLTNLKHKRMMASRDPH